MAPLYNREQTRKATSGSPWEAAFGEWQPWAEKWIKVVEYKGFTILADLGKKVALRESCRQVDRRPKTHTSKDGYNFMSQTETSLPETLRKRTINIRVTIDTDFLPRESPGDATNPTSMAQDQGHMVVTASHEVKNQGTGDVVFEAGAGDTLRFFISSGSNNFEQIVLLEDVRPTRGDKVLTGFTSQTLERIGIVPPSHTNVLPARLVQRWFRFCQCVVAGDGTGSYDLVFALYDRNEEGQPLLTGHYRWAIQLTAQSNRRKP